MCMPARRKHEVAHVLVLHPTTSRHESKYKCGESFSPSTVVLLQTENRQLLEDMQSCIHLFHRMVKVDNFLLRSILLSDYKNYGQCTRPCNQRGELGYTQWGYYEVPLGKINSTECTRGWVYTVDVPKLIWENEVKNCWEGVISYSSELE